MAGEIGLMSRLAFYTFRGNLFSPREFNLKFCQDLSINEPGLVYNQILTGRISVRLMKWPLKQLKFASAPPSSAPVKDAEF
jgi:hypothetical protein